jgi:hypothetical protein
MDDNSCPNFAAFGKALPNAITQEKDRHIVKEQMTR